MKEHTKPRNQTTKPRHTQTNSRSRTNVHNVSRKALIRALKISWLYMPTEDLITPETYGSEYKLAKAEHHKVKSTLISLGIDPNKVIDEVNPLQQFK